MVPENTAVYTFIYKTFTHKEANPDINLCPREDFSSHCFSNVKQHKPRVLVWDLMEKLFTDL